MANIGDNAGDATVGTSSRKSGGRAEEERLLAARRRCLDVSTGLMEAARPAQVAQILRLGAEVARLEKKVVEASGAGADPGDGGSGGGTEALGTAEDKNE